MSANTARRIGRGNPAHPVTRRAKSGSRARSGASVAGCWSQLFMNATVVGLVCGSTEPKVRGSTPLGCTRKTRVLRRSEVGRALERHQKGTPFWCPSLWYTSTRLFPSGELPPPFASEVLTRRTPFLRPGSASVRSGPIHRLAPGSLATESNAEHVKRSGDGWVNPRHATRNTSADPT